MHIDNGNCDPKSPELPPEFNCEDDWKFTDHRDGNPPDTEEWDPLVANNPRELYGVKGVGVNRAWEVSTGRPDVVISVMDSGIMWDDRTAATAGPSGDPFLVRYQPDLWALLGKHYLNRRELPMPQGGPNPNDTRFGGYDVRGATFTVVDATPANASDRDFDVQVTLTGPDGFFNVYDYWGDTRVTSRPHEGDLNENGFDNTPNGTIARSAGWPAPSVDQPEDVPVVDPDDLIRIFSDSVDDDNNGYVDDISGWDFFEDDNNPQDDSDYGHGSGEAEDSSGEVGGPPPGVGSQCPNCMAMSMRVGDSFVADVNHWAEAVVYAVDNGAAVVQEALGTLNHTSFGQAAADYAYENGVIINASEADESASHHNWPAAYDHTMVVNSVMKFDDASRFTEPYSYLYFNGCTNFGGYTFVSIPSTSCSSEATGRSSGVSGLLVSAARNAVEAGAMTTYIQDSGQPAPYPLSAEEMMQLWRLSADDIDFASDCLAPVVHAFCDDKPADVPAPMTQPDGYQTSIPDARRYESVKGWDYFFGYGRNNAARLLRFIGREGGKEYLVNGCSGAPPCPYGVGNDPLTAQDRIPPEADISSPPRWRQYAFDPDSGELLWPDDPSDRSSVVVEGRVAANRVTQVPGGTFDWVLEWAPQAQGQKDPVNRPAAGSQELSDGPWTAVPAEDCSIPLTGRTQAYEGPLCRIDVEDLLAGLERLDAPYPWSPTADPTSPFASERAAIRLRLRVIAHPADRSGTEVNEATADTVNNEAVMQKQIDVYLTDGSAAPYSNDESVLRYDIGLNGEPSGGAGAPSFHDVDGDGVDEMLLATEDGVLHAYTDLSTGEELPGWPVTTGRYPGWRTTGQNAYTQGKLSVTDARASMLLGTPAVADLDDDGDIEVLAADLEGLVHAWEPDGTRHEGFPVSVDLSLSKEVGCQVVRPACDDYAPGPSSPGGIRDELNDRDWGIDSMPAIGDLDPDTPGLEVLVGSNDGHVYAWHQDGSPVEGWPVILRDPAKVQAMDPATRHVTYRPDANALRGTKVLVTPTLGDIDLDGDLEVVTGVNEEYREPPNADLSNDPLLQALGAAGIGPPGNTRLYALHADGAAHPETDQTVRTAHVHDQAYVEDWPVPIAMLITDLLPYVGEGADMQAVIANVSSGPDNDPEPEIAFASAAGLGYVLNHDGSSYYGEGATGYRTLENDAAGAPDLPIYVAVGAMAAGSMDGGGHITIAGPGAGLQRALDLVLPEQQIPAEDYLSLWDSRTGQFEPNGAIIVNDLQFFTEPVIADVTGDGFAEVIQSTAVNDLVVAGRTSTSATARRYFTGGWGVTAAAVGQAPLGEGVDDGKLQIALVTREGWLRLWPTAVQENSAASCTALAEWPEYGHDAFNSGNYHVDGERPYPVKELVARVGSDSRVTLIFLATGDDRACGGPERYRVRILKGTPEDPQWEDGMQETSHPTDRKAGEQETLQVGPLVGGTYTIMVRAVDDAGNGSAVSFVEVTVPPGPSGPPSPGGGNEEPGGGTPPGGGAPPGGSPSIPVRCPGLEGIEGNHLVGTPAADRLVGTPGRDVICGLGGNDELRGLAGDDLILGGAGGDRLVGAGGADALIGQLDKDSLTGGAGKDVLLGRRDTDSLRGGRQDDRLRGGAGADTLAGGPQDDRLRGGSDTDRCRGGGAEDSLRSCER